MARAFRERLELRLIFDAVGAIDRSAPLEISGCCHRWQRIAALHSRRRGDADETLPTAHGFDEFFGSLYHLNAEEEFENEDYFKDPALVRCTGPAA